MGKAKVIQFPIVEMRRKNGLEKHFGGILDKLPWIITNSTVNPEELRKYVEDATVPFMVQIITNLQRENETMGPDMASYRLLRAVFAEIISLQINLYRYQKGVF